MDNVKNVIVQADFFLLSPLVEMGCNFLQSHLVVKNCIDIFRFAVHFLKRNLAQAARLYLLHNFHRVSTQHPFIFIYCA